MDNNFLNDSKGVSNPQDFFFKIPASSMPGIFFVQSFEGKVVAWNELFARSVVPQHSNAFTLIHSADSTTLQKALEEVILTDHEVQIEVRLNYRTPQNSAWYLFSISPIVLHSVQCFQFVGFDITEKIYHKKSKEFELSLVEANNDICLIKQLLDSLEIITGSMYAFCYYFEVPERNALIFSSHTERLAKNLEESLCSYNTNEIGSYTAIASATNADYLSDVLLFTTSFKRHLLLPIQNNSHLIGFICLGNKECDYNEHDEIQSQYFIDSLLEFFQQRREKTKRTYLNLMLKHLVQYATYCRLDTLLSRHIGSVLDSLQALMKQFFTYKELADSSVEPLNDTFKAIEDIAILRQDFFALVNHQTEDIVKINAYQTLELMVPFLEEEFNCCIELESELRNSESFITINPLHLKHIIGMLCKNAMEAMLYGNLITIRISNSTLSYEQERYCIDGDAMLAIALSDNGKGIDAAAMPHIFEPFFTTHSEDGARGLGLTIVRNLINIYHGDVLCHSEEGVGTTVTLQLPCYYQTTLSNNNNHSDILVLMVMSDAAMLSMLSLLLEEHGYTLLVANSVEEAVDLVESYSNTIDLLITETHLSECSGYDLAAFLSLNQSNMKVLYLASSLSHVDTTSVTQEEWVRFLHHPFSGNELLELVAHLCTP